MAQDTLKITVTNTQAAHCLPLAGLQQACFPTLDPAEWFSADMYAAQIKVFPEGQFVALADTPDGPRAVGGSTTFRTNQTFDGPVPYYFEFIGRGYLTNHELDGVWLYGVDISVHPDFRRMGIGSMFYEARKALVRRLNLRGELVAGLMPGYERYQAAMTIEDYAARVVSGELTDPTLTMQLRNGFHLKKLLRHYVHDPRSGDVCTLLVRENRAYEAE